MSRTSHAERRPEVRRRPPVVLALAVGVCLPLAVVTTPASAAASDAYTWRTGVRLSSPAPSSVPGGIVLSRTGSRVATTWAGVYAGWRVIWVATSTDGGVRWRAPVEVSRSSENTDPSIVSSADGTRLAVVWQRRFNGAVQVATSSDGGRTWRAPVDLTTPPTEPSSPRIISSVDGRRLTAAWLDEGEYSNGPVTIQTRTSTDAGVTWGPATTLDTATFDPAWTESPIELSGSADGSVVALAWRFVGSPQDQPGPVQVAVSSNGGGTWGPASALTAPGDTVASVQVSVAGDGSAVAVGWTGWSGAEVAALVRTSADGGATWTAPARLSPSGRDVRALALAGARTSDRVSAVWLTQVGAQQVVQGVGSTNGGVAWSAVRTVASWKYTQFKQAPGLQVALSDDGRRVGVAWTRRISGKWAVQAVTSVTAGRTWSPARTLSDLSAEAYHDRIGMSGNGKRVAVQWMRYPTNSHDRFTIRVATGRHR